MSPGQAEPVKQKPLNSFPNLKKRLFAYEAYAVGD